MLTLRIEDSYLEKFMRDLRSAKKKIEELGEECSWREKESSFEKVNIDGKIFTFKIHTFEVEGLSSYEGWKVIAQIEHLQSGNVIREFTDVEVPEIYRNRAGVCDHCGTDRPRKITYIVENVKEGKFVQLGRSCVSLYTGGVHLLDGVLPLLKLEKYDVDHMDKESLCASPNYLPVKDIIARTFATIEKCGFSKTRNEDGSRNPLSTFQRVIDDMRIASQGGNFEPQEAHYNRIPEFVKWVAESPNNNTFFSNVNVLLKEGYTSEKNAAYLVGAVGSFLKDEAVKNKVRASFVGEIGDKITFDVKEAGILTTFRSSFGLCYVYKIIDTEGHVFTTFTSRAVDVSSAKRVQGTVKNHEEARGESRTVLTRVKFLEK